MSKSNLSRREFMGATVAGAVASSSLAHAGTVAELLRPARRKVAASDKIVIGLIGCGGMGASNMRSLMQFDDVEVAAICDVDKQRMPGDFKSVQDKYGRPPKVFSDYRAMLEEKDIDAIIVGSPDHWHALNLIHAVEAGKDAYCEKPISHNITEARSMAAAAAHFNRIVQVGTWQRSTKEFTDAIAFARSGKLGKIVQVRAWINDGTRIGRAKPSTPPPTLDYDMWCGPAKMNPYQANKLHWNWRWVLNTGGGLTTDWGVHMIDIGLLGISEGNDLRMPTRISSVGGQYAFPDDDRDAPDTIESIMHFDDPAITLQWSVIRDHAGREGHGTEWITADGRIIRVWRGGWKIMDADGKDIPTEASEAPPSHWRNFLDCVKSRQQPRADIHSVMQTTVTCHLSNAALFCGETVHWDKKKMDIVGKAGKDTFSYNRHYREPYKLPIYKLV